ncbi:MAG TPA: hypothetical protein ACFYEK_11045 [Candidatus Wunengus sp. YC60]|uniref:hypothetical protein n=1 Tax=Candidatus Wunengus sp. YC60 TaxID=3367697 RepID=UPI00402789F4
MKKEKITRMGILKLFGFRSLSQTQHFLNKHGILSCGWEIRRGKYRLLFDKIKVLKAMKHKK